MDIDFIGSNTFRSKNYRIVSHLIFNPLTRLLMSHYATSVLTHKTVTVQIERTHDLKKIAYILLYLVYI